ncbi:MAG: thiamine-phosphate kinase [Legionella sp.]|nr:MAG: thiamine-phosphate kinase [Legionella sp.]PJD97129.1 MAG: thiamine-phosphate kinase [Legionella sp.]
MNEFELIRTFFLKQKQRKDVQLGIGDDCALVSIPFGHQLAVSMDTLIEGVHFPQETSPFAIGYKALAVNLSDLAAMGATPAWFTLALTLPKADSAWLSAFSEGLFTLARQFDIQLIGGDTTRGPLSITIQVHGFVPQGKAILRSQAKPFDLIYVTHQIGDAGLALLHMQKKIKLRSDVFDKVALRLNQPFPRVREGLLLREMASSMIDISDGLLADLTHLLEQSKVGALVDVNSLPLSSELKQSMSIADAVVLALTAGDDYELCFTLPVDKQKALEQLSLPVHCIGQITAGSSLQLMQAGQPLDIRTKAGYLHF